MFIKNNFRIIVIFLLFLLVISAVDASDLDFNFYRANYKAFETVQLNITINNISLTKDLEVSNLVLLSQDNSSSINIAKNKVKINNSFYVFYFDLPDLEAGDYNIKLSNVNYIKDESLKVGNFFTGLNVINGSTQIVSLRPAYVLSKVVSGQEAPFSLVVSNKGTDSVNINLQKDGDFFSLQSNSFTLAPNSIKTIVVSTSLFNKNYSSFNGSVLVNYGSNGYWVPFVVLRTDFVQQPNNSVNNTPSNPNTTNINLRNVPNALYLTTLTDNLITNLSVNINIGEYYPSGQIVVKNNAGVDIHNLNYYITGNILGMFDIQPKGTNFLKANDSLVFLLGINDSYNFSPGNYFGFLNVNSSDGAIVSVPVNLNVFGETTTNHTNFTSLFGEENLTQNNISYGNYTLPSKSRSSTGLIILFLIVFLIFILIYVIYRKTKRKEDEFEGFVEKVKSRRDY